MELCLDRNYIEKQGENISFSFPKVSGCHSRSGENAIFSPDAKQLRYWNKYCPREGKAWINLNSNPENNIREDPEKPEEFLSNLLKYIMMHKSRFADIFSNDSIRLSEAPIVCSRGLLRSLSSLPYILNKTFVIHCCLYKGVVYMHYSVKWENDFYQNEQKFIDWGFKFEQYMLADSPISRPDLSGKVIHNEHFTLIYRANLDKHNLIYNAEVDGVIVEDENLIFSNIRDEEQLISELDKSKFVEVKTKNKIIYESHKKNFSELTSLNWWLQSFYGRNHIILCGFKNKKDGMVRDIKQYDVKSLPNYSDGSWNTRTCLNSCNILLSHIKHCLSEELKKLNITEENIRSAPKIEIVLERKANSDIITKLENYTQDFSLLPQWYIDSFDNNNN